MDKVFLRVNGNVITNTEGATDPGAPPVVVPPVVHPPAGNYVAAGMWIYGQNRIATGALSKGAQKVGTFTIPSGWIGIVEFPVSGANFNMLLDGVLFGGDPIANMAPGPHTFGVVATAEAEGSFAIAHTP